MTVALLAAASLSADFNFSWEQEVTVPGSNEKYHFSVNDKDLRDAYEGKKQEDYGIGKLTAPTAASVEKKEPDIANIRRLAEQGNALFQFQLGRLYARGEGVEQDWAEAVKWYTLSAEKGNSKAQNNLGVIYRYDRQNIQRDYATALYWLEQSAAQDNSYAFLNLGSMYQSGEGVTTDYKKAMEYYKKGEKAGAVQSNYCIAGLYMDGLGVPKNEKKAFSYFETGAKKGDVLCQYQTGIMYRDGIGTKKNVKQAEQWLSRAAANGDTKAAEALRTLGN